MNRVNYESCLGFCSRLSRTSLEDDIFCKGICGYRFQSMEEKSLQTKFDSAMPLIGLYIAAASLACSVAMAGDLARGILSKKLWFPSNFFTMNAASLTLLAVVTKLTVDLTNGWKGRQDVLPKLASTVFLTTAMGNFLISLASMDDKAVLMNVIALSILLITVIVNECIQIVTGVIHWEIWPEQFVALVSMFVLFVTFSSSALAVPTTKSYLNVKYNELHKTISMGELEETERRIPSNGVLKEVVEKYWVMAVTSCPQFVMARSPACTASGAICLFTALTLVEAPIRMYYMYSWKFWNFFLTKSNSSYQWSIPWILMIQLIGVAIGTMAPLFRGYAATSFNCSNSRGKNLQNVFKVENYWIQRLVDWKERPLGFQIRWVTGKKVVHDTKNIVIDICIGIQHMIVVASKGILFISIVFSSPFFSLFFNCKRWMNRNPIHEQVDSSANHGSSERRSAGSELDLNSFVLLLEGEANLPKIVLKNIRDDFSKVVEMGTQHQPKNLLELLRKSSSFLGVTEFDSSQVPHILPQLPNCWSLPVVTLTSIAIALPNIEKQMVDRLLNSVSEGLSYASLMEESLLTTKYDLLNTKHAAVAVWVGVELKHKWLDKDLREMALKGKASKETLQKLANIAEKISILKFEKTMTGSFVTNPLSLPWKVIAANLMYRISQTILKDQESNVEQTDVELFEQLSIMIADILGACLTNLPRAITMKCYCSAVEEREKSVRHAARLVGETKEILEILDQHELPCLTSDQMAYIDEWRRAFMEHRIPSAAVIASSNNQIIAASDLAGEVSIDIK